MDPLLMVIPANLNAKMVIPDPAPLAEKTERWKKSSLKWCTVCFFLYDCVFHAKKKVMGWCVSKSENHQLKFQDLSRSKWRCPPLRIAVDLHHSERFRLPIGYLALVALVGKLLGFSSDLSGIDSFSWSGIWDFNHCSEIRIISWHVWTSCKYCDILLINWWLPDVWTINSIALHPFSTK